MRILTASLAPLLFCAVALPFAAGAEGHGLPPIDYDDDLDAGAARAAVLRGEILRLEVILARLRAAVPGEVVKIELGSDDGALIYEFDVLSPDGRLFEVEVDAASGDILDVEEEDQDD